MKKLEELYPPFRDRLTVVVGVGSTHIYLSEPQDVLPHLRTIIERLAASGRMDAVQDVSQHIRRCTTATLLELGLPLMGLAPIGARLPVNRMYLVAAQMIQIFHKEMPQIGDLSGEQVAEIMYQDLKRQGKFSRSRE